MLNEFIVLVYERNAKLKFEDEKPGAPGSSLKNKNPVPFGEKVCLSGYNMARR